MFPHPEIGKHIYRPCDIEQIRCGWQAAIALVIVMAGATLFDPATAPQPESGAVVAAAQCLNQKAAGRCENGDFRASVRSVHEVREHRSAGNRYLQPGMATFGSDTQEGGR